MRARSTSRCRVARRRSPCKSFPLPAAIVGVLSPHAIEIANATRLAQFGGAPPAWMTLSVDPDAHARRARARWRSASLTFWIARAVFSAGGSTRSFCRALAFIGAVAAVAAVFQKAVAPRSVLFMVEPEARSASPFGAFVNRNHFGGWLLMVAAPVVGYLDRAPADSPGSPRPLARIDRPDHELGRSSSRRWR